MFTSPTCERIFGGHCQHWNLTDEEHALEHAIGRLINAIADEDTAAGIDIRSVDAPSVSSVTADGPRLRKFLADEGWRLQRITQA